MEVTWIGVFPKKLYVRHGIPGSGGPDWLKSRYEWIVCATSGGKLPWSDNTAMGWTPVGRVPGETTHNTSQKTNGRRSEIFVTPTLSNPGNLIDCGSGGGGNIGSPLAHENEAPFPEKLAEFFIKSFCPPGGVVYDPYCGSGTSLAVA